jgi:S-adenosylmethionine:tRNA ribosyltransferase-isomerase
LVLNDSKVFPARLFGRRKDTNGKIEILLNRQLGKNIWEVVGKNLKIGIDIVFNNDFNARVINRKNQIFTIKFNKANKNFWESIEKIGHVPLPPYMGKKDSPSDRINYQTVYAKNIGSVAAPTAGLHFTKNLLNKIENKKINIAELTLHVGLGTWSPIKSENIEDHKIHSEYYEVPKETIEKILQTKKSGGRIIAVGTTTTRVLETIFNGGCHLRLDRGSNIVKLSVDSRYHGNDIFGETNIYIYPGYQFKIIDGLITNFHLPKSSLLLLVSAFAGKKNIRKAYEEAITQKYRFYSYGDAMLII